MRRVSRNVLSLSTGALLFLGGGCASGDGDGPRSPDEPSSLAIASRERVLSDAASRIDRLSTAYTRWYAGTVIDLPNGKLVIYRKNGSDFDGRVPGEAGTVKFELRDAAMSRSEMQALVAKVMADSAYWQSVGVTVNGGAPLPDGSGVSVMTATGNERESSMMSEHYGQRIVVTAATAVAPLATTPVRPPPR